MLPNFNCVHSNDSFPSSLSHFLYQGSRPSLGWSLLLSTMSASGSLQKVVVELSGGCELLFGKQSKLVLSSLVPTGSTLSDLVRILKASYLRERPEQFLDPSGESLRPGILVLVNDVDAEVVNGFDYVIEDGDTIEFVSTLHGG